MNNKLSTSDIQAAARQANAATAASIRIRRSLEAHENSPPASCHKTLEQFEAQREGLPDGHKRDTLTQNIERLQRQCEVDNRRLAGIEIARKQLADDHAQAEQEANAARANLQALRRQYVEQQIARRAARCRELLTEAAKLHGQLLGWNETLQTVGGKGRITANILASDPESGRTILPSPEAVAAAKRQAFAELELPEPATEAA